MDFDCGGEYWRRGHVPAFGSWDWNDAVPFTQCFETARQAGLLRYGYAVDQDQDLYLAGDLYDNHVVTPAMIVVPRRRAKVGQEPHQAVKRASTNNKQQKKGKEERETDALPSCRAPAARRRPAPKPKPVDEDLYKISPELLYANSKRRTSGGFGCFSRCFFPTRAM